MRAARPRYGAARATTYTRRGHQIKFCSSGEEQLEFLAADLGERALILAEDRVGEIALRALELENLLLDRPLRHESSGDHVALLANPVRAVDRLRLHRGIPPGVEQKDVVGRGEVEAVATCSEADQKELAVRILLKFFDNRLSVARVPVEISVANRVRVETLAQECEEARELWEHERLVPLARGLGELGQHDIELRARGVGLGARDQRRMAGSLPQPEQRFEHLHPRLLDAHMIDVRKERASIVVEQLVVD